MIQRIQTVYLALVLILSFVGLISTIGEWTMAETVVAHFSNFTFGAEEQFKPLDSISGPWCLGVLLIMVMFLSIVSIMLFRKRMRQLRLTIFSTILLVGYVAAYAVFAYYYDLNLNLFASTAYEKGIEGVMIPTFHFKFVATFPVLSIILNCLAIQGIRKDEALVRSLDRIR
ncbi:MAG: DUF4293 domain-containing protein [Bacteroidaceae bacterium]|jgi:phosphoglycerol transferase MdoB-like AlkP superfamily enzyme|nr:DUF4293 domain-containing protein [Bacteroidaceae bacterium]MBR6036082.1 DUF4293 domain-containing protein [Bacteroidaceae bacterium]